MLKEIAVEIQACRKCGLCETRNNPVPGEGDPKAKIVFVGEAPGYNEDMQGKPFVGAAGNVFEELLASAGLKKADVFVTNILKCRPPSNRNPVPDEIRACTPYLDRQLKAISPDTVCTLGNFATAYILPKFGIRPDAIGKIHGQVFKVDTLEHHLRIIPMYHPATVAYNPNMKKVLIDDWKVLAGTQK